MNIIAHLQNLCTLYSVTFLHFQKMNNCFCMLTATGVYFVDFVVEPFCIEEEETTVIIMIDLLFFTRKSVLFT